LGAVWKKSWILVGLNWLFFSFIVVGGFFTEAGAGLYIWPFAPVFPADTSNALFLFGVIAACNLVLNGFVLLTLTGLGFFVLPMFLLGFKAFLWGVFLDGLSTPLFLAALPIVILEGEGYVLASLAGVNLGLSWLKPEWAYKGEELSRSEAVKRAFIGCAHIYVLVAVFLLVAAVVEALTPALF